MISFSNLPDEKIIFIEDFCAMITHGHAYGVSMGYQNIRNEGRVRGVDAVMFGHTHRPLLEEDDDLILLNPEVFPIHARKDDSVLIL